MPPVGAATRLGSGRQRSGGGYDRSTRWGARRAGGDRDRWVTRDLDILVNNAAAKHTPTPFTELTDDDYDRIMAVNAKAVYVAIQFAATHMRDGGSIVSLSTLNTVLAAPGLAAYAGSKGAVEQFTQVAARELGAG